MKYLQTALMALGIVAGATLFVVGTRAAVHLWDDHQHFHTNGQLLELVRQAVVEKHPELLEENE
jgi:hypothetical protein